MTTRPDPDRPSRDRARGLLVVAALLAATGLAAAATRGGARPTPAGGATPGATAAGHGVTFHAAPDRTAVLAGGDGLVRVELVMEAERRGAAARVPTDLVVVLDQSGSMHGAKIAAAREAVHELVSQLAADDRFALVTFSNDARTVIPLAYAEDAALAGWRRSIDGVRAGGGTHMSTGLELGLGALEASRARGRAARVLVLSDGLAAEPPAVLRAQAARAAAGEFVLSTLGIGEDFDERLMTALADAGTGNFYFLENPAALAAVFEQEFSSARETVASGLAVHVRPPAGVRVVDAAGYPLERGPDGVRFRPGTLFAGQQRRVWVTLRVPTGEPGERGLGVFSLDFRARGDVERLVLGDLPRVAVSGDRGEFLASLDEDRWSRSVVEEELGALRQSVADAVRAGRRDEAREAIAFFRSRNAELNRDVASPTVAGAVAEASALEQELDDAFAGEGQARKQNLLSKSLTQESYDERRAGSKK